ncbi:STAS-like domain-containing protein [Ruminococcus sp.]|uniref:STAS-like domain-containing protein n=1 Tax=Ruminococcus sp. TaxID=41978 RepID=UPI002E77649F|nr:DUF4325 domain-containing protein [Ruminococcus sp.]MEE1262991.1 DUF4325 domain-containing protein [Ruminococcus sp.]
MNNSNSIKLVFDKTITRLAGYPYGEEIYEKQVKDHIDIQKPCTIYFPKNIESIASSFVQGFFSQIIDIIGFQGIEDNISIVSSSEELSEEILKMLI